MVLGFTMGSEKLMPFIGLLMGAKLPLSNEQQGITAYSS